MRVLIALVSGSVSETMMGYLDENGYESIYAYNANDVHSVVKEGLPDCTIIDLVGDGEGLSLKQLDRARGETFSYPGWELLKEILGENPDYRNRVIVYSSDLKAFREDFPDADLAGIVCIGVYENRSGGAEEVRDALARIAKMPPWRREKYKNDTW